MRIGLTLVSPERRDDVWLTAAADATAGQLERAIARHLNRSVTSSVALFRGATMLDPTQRLVGIGLCHGDQIGVGVALRESGTPAGTMQVMVVSGLDAGSSASVGDELLVGNGVQCGLRLTDPAVTQEHCRVRRTAYGWTIEATTMGASVYANGEAITEPMLLTPQEIVRVGNSALTLRPAESTPAVVDHVDGRLLLNRPPRLQRAPEPAVIEFPTRPGFPRLRLSWATLLAPLLMAGSMVAMGMDARFLVFALLGPMMSIGAMTGDAGPFKRRTLNRAYADARRDAYERLAQGLADEQRQRHAVAPDLAALVQHATGRSARLWERRSADEDFLSLRLGVVDQPSWLSVSGDADDIGCVARDVPLPMHLPTLGLLGVAGPSSLSRSLLRSLAVQVLTLHSPRDVRLVVLAEGVDPSEWDALKWAAHVVVSDGDRISESWLALDHEAVSERLRELSRILTERRADSDVRSPHYVVVVDGVQLTAHPALAELVRFGAAVGIYTVWHSDELAMLPEDCRAALRVASNFTASLHQEDGTVVRDVLLDGCSTSTLATVCTALAPLIDARPNDRNPTLPSTVQLVNLADLHGVTADDIVGRWQGQTMCRSTRALIGVGESGPMHVDLRADGPHGLVAGTTGAGKSELLQTLITSLALANHPDAMSFVLVDYKGGSAFKDCALLPHTVGMVTDLDDRLAERALTSLTAELKRREALFATAGVKDIEEYWQTTLSDAAPVPRLLIAVDEFASLVEEVPDFVRGLVGIARQGRSLGLHMILATQRPAGVVTADIRANTNLRICLRVTNASESIDIIDVPHAATISRATPGRGYVRTGHGELTAFQAARVGGTGRRPQSPPVVLTAMTLQSLQPEARRLAREDDEAGSSDLTRLIQVMQTAAEILGLPKRQSPWLPPLPTQLALRDLDPISESGVPLGLVDLPHEQRYVVRNWQPSRDGHLLAIGGPQSGRSSLLRTIAAGIATIFSAAEAHVYVLDGGNRTLSHLVELPHVGGVVGCDEHERVQRLLNFLTKEVRRRQRELAAAGVATLDEWRGRPTPSPARFFLLIDRYDALVAVTAETDGARLTADIDRLLRDGPAVGVHAAITSDRAGVSARLSSAIPAKLLLRMSDKDDYLRFGVPLREVPRSMPPGRALWLDGLVEMQVALLSDDPSAASQRAAFAALASTTSTVAKAQRPRRIEPLPSAISLSQLSTYGDIRADEWTLGLGGDELRPVSVALSAAAPGFLVAGPAGSGRSTALLTALHGAPRALLDGLPVAVVATRPSPLRAAEFLGSGIHVLTSDACLPTALPELGIGTGPSLLVIDDAELLMDSPVSSVLDDILRRADDTGTLVLAAGAADVLATSYRPWVIELRRSRTGVLLSPLTPMDGHVLGVTLPRSAVGETTPGRGLLVRAGTSTPMQVALPEARPCDGEGQAVR